MSFRCILNLFSRHFKCDFHGISNEFSLQFKCILIAVHCKTACTWLKRCKEKALEKQLAIETQDTEVRGTGFIFIWNRNVGAVEKTWFAVELCNWQFGQWVKAGEFHALWFSMRSKPATHSFHSKILIQQIVFKRWSNWNVTADILVWYAKNMGWY